MTGDLDDLRAMIEALRARVDVLEGKRPKRQHEERESDCPYAQIKGERPCTAHTYSGCGGRIPS